MSRWTLIAFVFSHNSIQFVISGFETTSSTLAYCLFELARNPEIQRKVQREIDEARAGITYEMISSLKYTECCIDETLRKYPIAPALMRECVQKCTIPGTNKAIAQGMSIFIPVLGFHRDPEIFENPLQFKPERFLSSPTGEGKSSGCFYLPFGDGPRNCIGAKLAKLTVKIGLIAVLTKFNIELDDLSMADKEVEFHPRQFLLTPLKPFNLKVSSRLK